MKILSMIKLNKLIDKEQELEKKEYKENPLDFFSSLRIIFINEDKKHNKFKNMILYSWFLIFLGWLLLLCINIWKNSLWIVNDWAISLSLYLLTISWAIYFMDYFYNNKELNKVLLESNLNSFLWEDKRLEQIYSKIKDLWLNPFKNPWSSYMWYSIESNNLKILELYNLKNNKIRFRLKYKDNKNFQKIIEKNKDIFRELSDSSRKITYIDYIFDKDNDDELKECLKYITECIKWYLK